MAKCGYCSTTVIFGGVRTRETGTRFCNEKCYNNALLLTVSEQISVDAVTEQVQLVHQGLCPKCKGSGPIDVHTKYQVWSALLVTSWSNRPEISCRACGRKNQLVSAFSSLLFGWWGFPWGFIMTPVQVTRNFIGVMKGQDDLRPSPMLERMVRLAMASQLVNKSQPPN